MTAQLYLALIATFFAVINGNAKVFTPRCMKNRNYQFFFIASAFISLGISSIAYRNAVRGITLLFFIT
jgi:hypothetical protein